MAQFEEWANRWPACNFEKLKKALPSPKRLQLLPIIGFESELRKMFGECVSDLTQLDEMVTTIEFWFLLSLI